MEAAPASGIESFDVVVIGAGISGIGAAYYLKKRCRGKSFVLLERRKSFGGTWDLFKYPGIRSDSDMYTFGYGFRPWANAKQIAPARDILAYLGDTISEFRLQDYIRYEHHVVRASWSSASARWELECEGGQRFHCKFLLGAAGYYNQDTGYEPEFPGAEAFKAAGGRVVHPQKWEEDGPVDYEGKRVVVIGSGATAVTLIPAMAEKAQHVVMLQRSPTYILPIPERDPQAMKLAKRLPASWVHRLMRWRMVFNQRAFFSGLVQQGPEANKKQFLTWMRMCISKKVMSDEEFAKHMTPRYYPWQQRLCLCPDGDFFKALHFGRASVVTDTIAEFDERGIKLTSGDHVAADIIVTATGLVLQENYPMATMQVDVDGAPYVAREHTVYRGCMLSGMPNFAFMAGYFNAAWTLKIEATLIYLCDLINHMELMGYSSCYPKWDPAKDEVETAASGLTSGYVLRSQQYSPKYGKQEPWKPLMSVVKDAWDMRFAKMEDGALAFTGGIRSRL